jgi:hypothetical protein
MSNNKTVFKSSIAKIINIVPFLKMTLIRDFDEFFIREVFEEGIISRGLWPPRSPDPSFRDFYLWGNVKQEVYKNNPCSIEALQNEITHAIRSTAVYKLQKVSHNLFKQCEACLQAEGGHFEHLL